MSSQEREIAQLVARESGKLKGFIRRWGLQEADAEDILQDVFYELVEAYRMMRPLQNVGAWIYRVARNRIVDRFRMRSREGAEREPFPASIEGEALALEEWLPSAEGGPEAAYARRLLLKELDAALDELPETQRTVFIAHELEGVSFKELSRRTGLPVNTLLSRKRYAVLHLRKRLKAIYEEYVHV